MSATTDDTTTANPGEQIEASEGETESGGSARTDQQAAETERALPLNQVFELLKNERRREVLHYLEQADEEPVTIGELAEHIAAIENDTTVEAISSSQRKRVYVGLYQCHLPKMHDCNVVEFEQNRGHISTGENADQLKQFLDVGDDEETPWYRYYLLVALGGAGLFVLSQAGGAAVGLTPTFVLGLVIAAVTGCSLLNLATRHEDEDDTA